MKIFIFLVGIGWDWGILGSNNLMNWWDINPPFMYCVFHHISDHLQRLILFWQFYKKVGLRSDPPPWLVQKTKFVKGFIFGAPLSLQFKLVFFKLNFILKIIQHNLKALGTSILGAVNSLMGATKLLPFSVFSISKTEN